MQINHTLIAINRQGASVSYHGQSQRACLRTFDAEYYRAGFMIKIITMFGEKIIKKTFN